jgi:hypothetical protein
VQPRVATPETRKDNSASTARLEQEEIDRIVEQIIAHLRSVKDDGEKSVELSEQKKST